MEEINEKLHMQLQDFDKTKREKWMKERKPFSVLFELTPRCNMNCIHCYLQNNHAAEQMSYEEIIKIIDILYNKGILFLTFTGGEILTRKDFIDIYVYAKKKGFLVELFTNAYLMTDEIIAVLKEYPPLLVDVSLYGASEETYYEITRIKGAYNRVVTNCKKMVEAGIRVSLKSPILMNSIGELDAMKKIAHDMNVPFVYTFDITPTIDKSDIPRNYQLGLDIILKYEFLNYYEQVEKGERKEGYIDVAAIEELDKCEFVYACNVALNSFIIDYKGNMCPCMKLRHKGVRLLDADFDAIWEEFKYYSKIKACESYKCKKCKSRYFCDICPAEMDLLLGDAQERPNRVCAPAEIRKKFYFGEVTFEEAIKLAALNE